MGKEEFVQELRDCLYGEVKERVILDSVSYYRSYIEEQIRSGKSEQQVLDELGDASFIAKSIIDANERESQKRTTVEEEDINFGDPYEEMEKEERRQQIETKASRIVHWIIAIAVLVIIVTIVATVARILLPIVLVVAVVAFIIRLFHGPY